MDTSFGQNMREKRANCISIHYANLNIIFFISALFVAGCASDEPVYPLPRAAFPEPRRRSTSGHGLRRAAHNRVEQGDGEAAADWSNGPRISAETSDHRAKPQTLRYKSPLI